jgi:predicted ATPase
LHARVQPAGSSFVGRAEELAALLDLITQAGSRLVTVTGVPGVGKTRLAMQVCAAAERDLDLPSVFVPLATLGEAASIPAAVATAWRERAQPGDPALIVLDNSEHLPGAAVHAAELLAASPGLTVLVTSTVALGIPGEQVFRLGPFPHRRPEELEPAEIYVQPSVQLFAERARAADASFGLVATNVDAVTELCAVLGGLPLAIELAAARVAAFPPAALLAQLRAGAGLDLLRTNRKDSTERHRSIRQALSWTYDLLSESAQQLLVDVSVFAGSFSLAGVAAVTETPDEELGDLFDLVSALVDARLLEPYSADATSARFSLAPLVRMFAREHLVAAGQFDHAQLRHCAFVQALAREAGQFFEDGDLPASFARLEPEWAEITAALDLLYAAGRIQEGLQLAVDCAPFLLAVGYDASARGAAHRSRSKNRPARRGPAGTSTVVVRAPCPPDGEPGPACAVGDATPG